MAELNYDITPRNAPRFAADVVAIVEENEGVRLDYSAESLEVIDRIVGGFREEGVEVEDVAATLFSFGCYVGEVFVRHAGATWRKASQQEIEDVFGVPLVLSILERIFIGTEGLTSLVGAHVRLWDTAGAGEGVQILGHIALLGDIRIWLGAVVGGLLLAGATYCRNRLNDI